MLVEVEISDERNNRSRYNLSSSSAKAVRQEKAKLNHYAQEVHRF